MFPQEQLQFNQLKKAAKTKNESSAATKLICMQVRLGGQTEYRTSDMSFGLNDTAAPFIEFIQETFLSTESTEAMRYKIYVTSDRDFVKEEAINAFGAERVLYFNSTSFHTERGQL